MSEGYWNLVEPSWSTCSSPFGLASEGVPIYECLRLLCGTVDLQEKTSNKLVKPRSNFIKPGESFRSNSSKKITKFVFDNDLSEQDVEDVLKKIKYNNKSFWTNLRNQLCLLLLALKQKNHVECFLIIYRIFEKISIAVPLIYASIQSEYSKAHSFLKALNSNSSDGELAAFRELLPVLCKEGSYDHFFVEYNYQGHEIDWSRQLDHQLKSRVLDKNKNIQYQALANDEGFRLHYTSILSFHVDCRNRLFHNQNSRSNFDLWKLNGGSELCEILCPPTISWLALILTDIFKIEAKRVV